MMLPFNQSKTMKKQLLSIIALLLMSHLSFSQSDAEKALLDKMSKEACDKIEKAGIKDKDDAEEIKMKLGLALLPVIQDNKKEIKSVLGLDITVPDQIKMVGQKLGEHAVFTCPKFQEVTMLMLKKDSGLADEVNERLKNTDTPPTAPPAAKDETVMGKISKIEGADVAYIYVNTDEGETIKLLWLEDFQGSTLLTDGTYTDKKFHFIFVKKSIYQPQTKSYKDVKVITALLKS
ncbi:MAG: uncharacterized protein JWP12_406 [Bacteroidetes bacterium]|nr:uncharacterized protein [Bacteroidota bacterium]